MAKIVLGLATSHSPNVSTVPELWALHAERDRRNPNLDFAALVKAAPPDLAKELTPEVFAAKHEACQKAIDVMSEAWRQSDADLMLVIGDDQRELFLDECSPVFALYSGQSLLDIPPAPETVDPSHKPALWSRHANAVEVYQTQPELTRQLIQALCAQGFDVANSAAQIEGRSLGHAYTFARLRLMRDHVKPMIPVFINCYYPPNQPSAQRCFDFGMALRRAIDGLASDSKIAIVASGGLSHFIIDEALDQQVIAGITQKRRDLLDALPMHKLNSGNSEIRNWIAAAGAMQDMPVKLIDYVPAYRSEAGTGCGMAFARWDQA